MRKGRVSDCILTSSHLIPVASAHAIWRVPRLVCVPPKIRIRSTLPHIRVNECNRDLSPTIGHGNYHPHPELLRPRIGRYTSLDENTAFGIP